MKALDWPIMIARLNKQMNLTEIEKETGIHFTTLGKVKQECQVITAWDNGIALLDLYIKKFGADVPRYGDHNV